MKKYENEEYNVEEIENIIENIYFEAEEFKDLELTKQENEEFIVKEIEERKVDVFPNSKKQKSKQSFSQKLNRIKTSLNSVTSTTVATSMVAVVGVVSAGAILPEIINESNASEVLPHEHIAQDGYMMDDTNHWHVCECGENLSLVVHTFDEGVITKNPQEGIEGEEKFTCLCGYSYTTEIPALESLNIEFLNYVIDYDDESKLTLYFNNELEEDTYCVIVNTKTNEQVELTNDFIVFENLEFTDYEFEVKVYDKENFLLHAELINVDLSKNPYLGLGTFSYAITYNEDSSSNLYILLDNPEYFNSIELYLKDENILPYEPIIEENLVIFENIKESEFNLEGKSYYINQNTHTIYEYLGQFVIDEEITFDVLAEFAELTLTTPYQIEGDLKVVVQYLDINEKEEFIVSPEEINGQPVSLRLSRIVDEYSLSIDGNFYASEPNIEIDISKGNYYKKFSYSQIVNPTLYSYVGLDKLEILNGSYSEMYNEYDYGIPTKLYFNGYLLDTDSLTVNVYNSDKSVLLDSVENIQSFDKAVAFYNLDTTDELIFECIIYQDDVVLTSGEYKTMASIPDEYSNLDFSVIHQNPNDVYLTYNEDGTYNAYFNLGFVNNTQYEIVNKIELTTYDEFGERVAYQYEGADDIAVIYNIESGKSYGLSYATFVKDGINYYAASEKVVPSGTVESYAIDNRIELDAYFEETDTVGVYETSILTVLNGDVEISVKLDSSETIEIVIPYDEVAFEYDNQDVKYASLITLDLSNYEFETAEITINMYGNPHYGDGERIKNSGIEVVGNDYCYVVYQATIYK